jgi:hypothetical protein
MLEQLKNSIEEGLKKSAISNEDAAKMKKRFKEAFDGYTYLILQTEEKNA